METTNKTKIYNVIILDKSGSMSTIAKQAVDGVNETLGGIRSSQLKDPTQDNYVTLVAFCGCELRTIYDNTPIAEVRDITPNDYRPCCMTPLYDAVGTTITRLHPIVTDNKGAAAVTIITDGYENASHEYSGKAIKDLIERYKNEGWMFAYIGADHDVEAVAAQMSIDNTLVFDKTDAEPENPCGKTARVVEVNRLVHLANEFLLCGNAAGRGDGTVAVLADGDFSGIDFLRQNLAMEVQQETVFGDEAAFAGCAVFIALPQFDKTGSR